MTDATDPLGRLADHVAHPYDHPPIDEKAIVGWWRDFYFSEAAAIGNDLGTELDAARAAVSECQGRFDEAAKKCLRLGLPEDWSTEQRKRGLAIERDNLRHRLVRLKGRHEALADETKRRRS